MTQEIVLVTDLELVTTTRTPRTRLTVDQAIEAWIKVKHKPGSTGRTITAYRSTITSFRTWLIRSGLDLDSSPDEVAFVAQAFSTSPAQDDGQDISASTANRRLACISSFYRYCLKSHVLVGIEVNPIAQVERQSANDYESAQPHDPQHIKDALGQIDRQTLVGSRDYALLLLALTTGRRLSEVAGLKMCHLQPIGRSGGYQVRFRCKGNKIMLDKLALSVGQAIDHYLTLRGGKPGPDAPVWIALDRGHYGQPLSIQSLANICEQRLGTSKFHSLRHTFAHTMEESGAKVSDIQARLGHSSLDTTGRYLAALKRAENAHADVLADLFTL